MFSKLKQFFAGKRLDLAQLEEILVAGDVAIDVAQELISPFAKCEDLREAAAVLKREMLSIMKNSEARFELGAAPYCVLLCGVNGGGKTTTIGKLATMLARQGKRVAIAACDTFRTSAVEQLRDWAKIAGAEFISRSGADPKAVAFDAVKRSEHEGFDALFIDTAGRLGNNAALMDELAKIVRAAGKAREGAPNLSLVVLDASAGQNSLAQYEAFCKAGQSDGIVATKLNGTAKAGFLLTLARRHGAKIFFTTAGEAPDDIEPFSAQKFVDKLFA